MDENYSSEEETYTSFDFGGEYDMPLKEVDNTSYIISSNDEKPEWIEPLPVGENLNYAASTWIDLSRPDWKDAYVLGNDPVRKTGQSESTLNISKGDLLPGQALLTTNTTPRVIAPNDEEDFEELSDVTITIKFMCSPDEIGDRISKFADALNEIPYEELMKFKIKVD